MTPTLCTGSSTANAWAVLRYQPACLQLVEEDRVGLAQRCRAAPAVTAPEAAHRQARAGERMSPDHLLRQAQFQPELAHFVLEQVAERLDQLEAELLGQAADVVVHLDRRRRAVRAAAAFDHVGIERALGQELGVLDVPGFVAGRRR